MGMGDIGGGMEICLSIDEENGSLLLTTLI